MPGKRKIKATRVNPAVDKLTEEKLALVSEMQVLKTKLFKLNEKLAKAGADQATIICW